MRNFYSSAVMSLPKFKRVLVIVGISMLSFSFSGCAASDDWEIYATVHGTVTDYQTGEALSNAGVVLSPTNQTKQTGPDGAFRFEDLDAQQYTITVQKSGYQVNRKIVTAISGESVEAHIQLTKIPE